jgi:hypothetical protein
MVTRTRRRDPGSTGRYPDGVEILIPKVLDGLRTQHSHITPTSVAVSVFMEPLGLVLVERTYVSKRRTTTATQGVRHET